MTALACRRGEVRAALLALLPHAGRASEQTPDYGRVRFHAAADELVAWTTDGTTSAVARMAIDEHLDDELDQWDMTTHEIRAALAVLKRPTNPDEQSIWDDAECRIDVLGKRVRFTETGDLFGGRDVAVGRLPQCQNYPDVPRAIHDVITGARLDTPHVGVRGDLLARFATSAKPYEGTLILRASADPGALLVVIGSKFVGELPTRVAAGVFTPEAAEAREGYWDTLLTPLRRPVVPQVPDDVVDRLRAQAAEFFAEDGTDGVTLTVVRGDDS